MATYAPTTYPAATGTLQYVIGFPYADRDDVRVYVDGVEVPRGSGSGEWLFTDNGSDILWVNTEEPTTGETIVIRRVTDISGLLVDFSDGAGAVARDHDQALQQLLYATDELQVSRYDSGLLDFDDIDDVVVTHIHTLGVKPTWFEMVLECKTTDADYAVGDVVPMSHIISGATGIIADATNITTLGALSTVPSVVHKTTRVATLIDKTKWYYRLRARV